MAYIVAPLWHIVLRRYGMLARLDRGAVMACIVAFFLFSSVSLQLVRYGMYRGAAIAYSVALLWHTSWRRCGIYRGAGIAYIVAT